MGGFLNFIKDSIFFWSAEANIQDIIPQFIIPELLNNLVEFFWKQFGILIQARDNSKATRTRWYNFDG